MSAIRRVGPALILLLTLSSLPFVRGQTPPTAFPLRPGTIEGNINDLVPSVRYSFEAQSGDSVTITMETTSGDLDPLLTLYGPDDSLIERNDDRVSGDRNAEIALTLSRAGTHTIEAARFASGTSSGTFRLTLAVSGTVDTEVPDDPLAAPPAFGVQFRQIEYQEIASGRITSIEATQYFAVGAQQGDLVRIIVTRTSNDLVPIVRVLNATGEAISRQAQSRAGESIVYVTFPEVGWYLIEVTAESGSGSYDLYASRLANAVLQIGAAVTNTFIPQAPSTSYIVNARLGDLISLNMFATNAESGVQPELELLDLNLNVLARTEGERFATLRTTIPRSAPYIVRASNRRPDTTGDYSLRLISVPAETDTFSPALIGYNSQARGSITDDAPLAFYEFSGKTDELITLSLTAESGGLDPFVILMDSDFNELAFNDDAGVRADAQLTQFRLPKDGEYFVVASRSDLAAGGTTGDYRLALTVGEIALENGVFSATLTWTGGADLNLFVRDPMGRVISWSAPASPTTGRLQIDSNTGCETPSDEPVEHAYWGEYTPGDYEVWAWYQDGCGRLDPVDYTLIVRSSADAILTQTGTIDLGQRFEVPVRLIDQGPIVILDEGAITTPSAQITASEGGDAPIRFGEALRDGLDDQVFARFYRFQGEAGQRVRINADRVSGDLDVVIVLRDANNVNLPDGTNDDADAFTDDAELVYTLPTTDEYVIAVTRFGVRDGLTSGDYRLALTLEPAE